MVSCGARVQVGGLSANLQTVVFWHGIPTSALDYIDYIDYTDPHAIRCAPFLFAQAELLVLVPPHPPSAFQASFSFDAFDEHLVFV